jgi:hypothetical protein
MTTTVRNKANWRRLRARGGKAGACAPIELYPKRTVLKRRPFSCIGVVRYEQDHSRRGGGNDGACGLRHANGRSHRLGRGHWRRRRPCRRRRWRRAGRDRWRALSARLYRRKTSISAIPSGTNDCATRGARLNAAGKRRPSVLRECRRTRYGHPGIHPSLRDGASPVGDQSPKCAIPHGHNEFVTVRLEPEAPFRFGGDQFGRAVRGREEALAYNGSTSTSITRCISARPIR